MTKQTEEVSKDTALRMAIETMEILDKNLRMGMSKSIQKLQGKMTWEAIAQCKEALAETQEPVYTNGDRTMSMKDRNFTSEGNGYIQDNNFDFDAGLRIGGDFVNDEQDQYAQMICNALNTTPPSREHKASLWQGLSDAELDLIVLISGHSYKTLAEKIEAKLREKNNA